MSSKKRVVGKSSSKKSSKKPLTSSKRVDRSITNAGVKRLLKHGSGSGLRIAEDSVDKARLFAEEKIKVISSKIAKLVQTAKRQTIQKSDVVTVFSDFLPCLIRFTEVELSNTEILRVGNERTFTVSAVGRLVKSHTGLRITEDARLYLAVGLARIICKVGKISGTAASSRATPRKTASTLLERDIDHAISIIKNA